MSLIPVQFRKTNPPTPQPHTGDPFKLSPSSLPVHFLQPIQVANRGADRNRLDVAYLINDLEIHDRKPTRGSGLFGSTCVRITAQRSAASRASKLLQARTTDARGL